MIHRLSNNKISDHHNNMTNNNMTAPYYHNHYIYHHNTFSNNTHTSDHHRHFGNHNHPTHYHHSTKKYSTKKYSTKESGTATTEAAILMIIVVPVLLYLFFVGEVGMLLLDSQEQVISSIWDYSTFPFNMSQSPKWLEYNGKDHNKQNQLAAHNRLQYADGDSAFTNEARFKGNTLDMSTDYFSTLAFVQPTHCDSDCQNYRHDYKDNLVHEVICWQENKKTGQFLEGKLPLSSTEQLRKNSKGGLAVCQVKARLKNYLLINNLYPEFNQSQLWEGDKYKRDKRVIDYRSNYRDIVIRYRAALLTDSWALTDKPNEHKNSNTVVLLQESNSSNNTEFSKMTNKVLNGSLLGVPTLAAILYMSSAISKNLMLVAALPTGQLSSISNSNLLDSILDKIGGITALAGLPNIMDLNMVTNYSHNGKKLDDYKYDMTGDTGDAMFTTPIRDKYEQAWNHRGTYYMGNTQEASD